MMVFFSKLIDQSWLKSQNAISEKNILFPCFFFFFRFAAVFTIYQIHWRRWWTRWWCSTYLESNQNGCPPFLAFKYFHMNLACMRQTESHCWWKATSENLVVLPTDRGTWHWQSLDVFTSIVNIESLKLSSTWN